MTQDAQHSPLLTAPIPLMTRKIGIPVAVGATFNTLYNVVDTIYGGLISDDVLAALSLSFPIFFLLIAFGYGFAQGTTALIGNSMGRDDMEQAQQRSVQTLVFGLLISAFLTIFVTLFSSNILELMGATDPEFRQLAIDYVNPLFYGAVFFISQAMMGSILNALGQTKPGRNVLIGGFFLNLILDPWFVFGGFGLPAMGIMGIALATVLVQALGCIYLGYVLMKTELISADILRRHWVPNLAVFWRILEQGFPTMLDTLGVSFGFFILNFYVADFGRNAIAAFGAASRLEQLALLPLLGLNIAVISLVSRNNGAKKYDRVQESLNVSLKYGSIIMFITMVLVGIFARPLMRLFSSDPEIIQMGVEYVWIRNLALIPSAFFFLSSSAMRGIERPIIPLVFNLLRFFALPWLLIVIFVKWLGYGLTAIWVTSTIPLFVMGLAMYLVARAALPKPE